MRLQGFPLVVIYISAVGTAIVAIVASYVAVRAVSWSFGFWMKLSLILTAVFAAAYHVSYWWLLLHPTQAAEWSQTMRPVGMLAWFLGPWLALPLSTYRQARKVERKMRTEAEELLKEVRGSRPDSQEVP